MKKLILFLVIMFYSYMSFSSDMTPLQTGPFAIDCFLEAQLVDQNIYYYEAATLCGNSFYINETMQCYQSANQLTAGLLGSHRDRNAALLCSGASSNAPVDCFLKAKNDLRGLDFNTVEAALLCSGAKSNKPLSCFLEAYKLTTTFDNHRDRNIAYLCNGTGNGTNSDTPLNCFVNAKSKNGLNISTKNAALLCSRSNSLMPLECFKQAKKELDMYDETAALLCSQANSLLAPLDCFKTAKLELWETEAALLCSQAKSQEPIACFHESQKIKSHMPWRWKAAFLCSGATNDKPLKCYKEMTSRNENTSFAGGRALFQDEASVLCSQNGGLNGFFWVLKPENKNR
ncbi:MAG: hypothetical protein HY843_07835 [Bdellovibrio sp.]|nr:hypothetical protein [Bdellovibrio sp.]